MLLYSRMMTMVAVALVDTSEMVQVVEQVCAMVAKPTADGTRQGEEGRQR